MKHWVNYFDSAKVTVYHEGIAYPVEHAVCDRQVVVFNDVLYAANPNNPFLPTDKIRFEIVAKTWEGK